MAISVIVSVEKREILLELENGTAVDLQEKFMEFAVNDNVMKLRVKSFLPTFYSLSTRFKRMLELPPSASITDGQTIEVRWINIHLEESQDAEGENLNDSSDSTQIRSNITATNVPSSTQKSSSLDEIDLNPLSKETDWGSLPNIYGKAVWEKIPLYEKEIERNRKEKDDLIESMGFGPGFVPNQCLLAELSGTRKQGVSQRKRQSSTSTSAPGSSVTKIGKGAALMTSPETPVLRRSARNKNNSAAGNCHNKQDGGDWMEEMDQGLEEVSVTPPGSVHSSIDVNAGTRTSSEAYNVESDESCMESDKENSPPFVKSPKRRRRPVKKIRLFGEVITDENAMPKFADDLVTALEARNYSRAALMSSIKCHIVQETKDEYPTRQEYVHMCGAIISQYPVLADVDPPYGFNTLKKSIQTSFSAERSYRNNVKPGREARKLQARPVGSVLLRSPQRQEENIGALIEALKNIDGQTQENRVKFLVRKTLTARRALNSQKSSSEIMGEYPHYKNSKMLNYEFSLAMKIEEAKLLQNAQSFSQRLNLHYKLEPSVETGLQAIETLVETLMPRQDVNRSTVRRIVELKDEIEVEGDPQALYTGYNNHAPCQLIVVGTDIDGERCINKAVLLADEKIVSSLDNPSIPQAMVQLLAAYFLFKVQYPRAYKSFLRCYERYILGKLTTATAGERAKQEYTKFTLQFENRLLKAERTFQNTLYYLKSIEINLIQSNLSIK